MKRTEPKSFELGAPTPIWARPDEDLQLHTTFTESVIDDIDFELVIEEYNWPYMPSHYEPIDPVSISTGFTEEKIVNQPEYQVMVTVDKDTISDLVDRKLDLRLYGEKDGTRWVVVDTTLVVSQGD